ncbi:MAG: hypothetical protein K2M76_00305, partial [Muribaculaceae bacterium]|nr:hypothetical protein [Muribaculaceae bacterium]
ISLALYVILNLHRIEVSKGIEHIWLIMLMKDQTFVDVIKYFPPILGLTLGIVQMAPEVSQKRLKLTLHLPVGIYQTTGLMLLTGTMELILIFMVQCLMIGVYYTKITQPELTWRVLLTMIPWYIAGLNAYIYSTAAYIERSWRQRIVLGCIGISILCFYYAQPAPEAYNNVLAGCLIVTGLSVLCFFNSIIRFKEGL